jgi:hypothetical protein
MRAKRTDDKVQPLVGRDPHAGKGEEQLTSRAAVRRTMNVLVRFREVRRWQESCEC